MAAFDRLPHQEHRHRTNENHDILIPLFFSDIRYGRKNALYYSQKLKKIIQRNACILEKVREISTIELNKVIINIPYTSGKPPRVAIVLGSKTAHKLFTGTDDVHAEKSLRCIRTIIEDVESISLTYSPCSSCTVHLILAFWFKQPKPTIRYLFDDKSKLAYKHVEKNRKLLSLHGFNVEATWDFDILSKHSSVPKELIQLFRLIIEQERTSNEWKIENKILFNFIVNNWIHGTQDPEIS